MFHPHIIALGCLFLASFLREQRDPEFQEKTNFNEWLTNLNVNFAQVGDVTRDLFELYETWNVSEFDDEVKNLITTKMPRIQNPIKGLLS